jgi:hypothetical protein
MIFVAQIAVESGIYYYFYMIDRQMALPMTAFNALTTILLCAVFEFHYRKVEDGREIRFKTPIARYSRQQFENMIKEGRKLVTLDDLILDVEQYAEYHPGGAFVINHNVGREVDKYFYGGYALEDGMLGWRHSNISRKIVNDLSIGVLE